MQSIRPKQNQMNKNECLTNDGCGFGKIGNFDIREVMMVVNSKGRQISMFVQTRWSR